MSEHETSEWMRLSEAGLSAKQERLKGVRQGNGKYFQESDNSGNHEI